MSCIQKASELHMHLSVFKPSERNQQELKVFLLTASLLGVGKDHSSVRRATSRLEKLDRRTQNRALINGKKNIGLVHQQSCKSGAAEQSKLS